MNATDRPAPAGAAMRPRPIRPRAGCTARVLLLGLALSTGAAARTDAPVASCATVVARWPAEEAKQGVAVDADAFYAISNNRIGKYDKRSGVRIAGWEGDPKLYPHINSCVVDGRELVCAASNYPHVPMASVVEVFDTQTLRPVRSLPLPPAPGSLTWIERRGDVWFGGFANYPVDHGGLPGHDHRWTTLIKMDGQFRPLAAWTMPDAVLDRFAPMSNSGGSWGEDGLLYLTGHDRPELYALRLPVAGTVLDPVATIAIPSPGQAFAWDRSVPGSLWTIDRAGRSVVVSRCTRTAAAR